MSVWREKCYNFECVGVCAHACCMLICTHMSVEWLKITLFRRGKLIKIYTGKEQGIEKEMALEEESRALV